MSKANSTCALSASVQELANRYGLSLNSAGQLEGDDIAFVELNSDSDVQPSERLPSITHGPKIFYLVPRDVDLGKHFAHAVRLAVSDAQALSSGVAILGSNDLSAEEVTKILSHHARATYEAQKARYNRKLLEKNRSEEASLFASSQPIENAAPMLVEGLMRESGVSVFFGAFDEFKTTLVLDMVAHVAIGATWQGRKVNPTPVIWYALEGADEIPIRVRALEAKLRRNATPWGSDFAPIVVRDRIPDSYIAWRTEVAKIRDQISEHARARFELGELQPCSFYDEGMNLVKNPNGYPYISQGHGEGIAPLIVIDTLSLALGGEDEKGPRAAGFINECLDLLKQRDDLSTPDFVDDYTLKLDEKAAAQWLAENPGRALDVSIHDPVAEHVVIIHHQTKTGTDFAGHRAIAANTHGLYRVHRFGKMSDRERPYAGQLTPIRVKGMARPAPMRFEVQVVPVEGTERTAVILKDKATEIPNKLVPAIEALRELPDHEAITPADLNECLDVVASEGRGDAAKRQARKRIRDQLEEVGVIEPIEVDGKVTAYRFHDPS